MRTLVMAVLLIAAPVAAHAQVPDAATGETTERFLRTLKDGKVDEALKGIADGSSLLAARLATDPTLASQINVAIKAYGPVLDWERIGTDTVGTAVRRDTYLVRHNNMVTRWRFVFVRAQKDWAIAWFGFDDQVQNWLNEPG